MNDGWETIEETVAAFKESKAPIACICSTDARYQEIVEPLAQALRAAGAKKIVVAGNPGNNQDAWTQAGVDTAIFMGCNALRSEERRVGKECRRTRSMCDERKNE